MKMRETGLSALSVALLLSVARAQLSSLCTNTSETVYDFSLTSLDESRNISLSEYTGKVLLVMNTATY